MQNLTKNHLPLDVTLFEVEELEERLENSWRTCYCPVQRFDPQTNTTITIYVECDCRKADDYEKIE
jgi:hypothetical protein